MESSAFSVTSLLIVSLLALLVPLLVNRIRAFQIPIVVGEILVGIVVGKSGFNIIQASDWLNFLQFFGLSYLMFVSGLEIDFGALRLPPTREVQGVRRWLKSAPSFAIFACLVTFGLSYLLSESLYHHHMVRSPLLMALIITTTSLTVVVPVLKEYDVLSTSFGQLLLAAAVFADFVTMSLISVAVSLFRGGFSSSVFLVFVLILVLILLYRVSRRFMGFSALRGLAHGTAQLGIRACLALMMVFIVLSQSLGVQVILGTFLAGILVSLVNQRERSDIYSKLDAIGFGFLIPIFFIMVGVNFDIHSLFGDPKALILLPILFVATYLFKALPVLILRTQYPWRQTMAGGFLLTTQMSVTVAAAAVGLKIGAISPGVDTAIILVAMLTSVISPVLFGKLLPRKFKVPDRYFVVVGNSPGAQFLVEQIRKRDEECRWFQSDETPDYDVASTRAFVAYGDNDLENLKQAKAAAAAGVQPSLCLVRDLQLYRAHQADEGISVVNPQLSSVTLMDQWMHYPISTQLLEAPVNLQIQEIRLYNRDLHQARLMHVELPGNLLILSIVRDGLQIVPHGETALNVGDVLVVVGPRDDVVEFARLAGTR